MSTGSRMGLLLASLSAWTTSVQLWMDGGKKRERITVTEGGELTDG